MRPSTCGHWASPLLIRAAWSRGAVCVVRGWISRRLWWREWLGRRDADELRDTGDADAINPDAINPHREPSDSIHTTPTVTAPTGPTPTVSESQTTTVVAVAPPPATTTTSGVSPAAAAAAGAAAASQEDESSSTQWGWIAFAILAAAVLIGGIVWWWRRHSAQTKAKANHPDRAPQSTDA